MKKFRYAFPISAYVVYALLFIVSVVSIVFAALRLGEVGGMFSVYPISDVLSIVFFSIAIVAELWIMFFSNYVFCDDTFVMTRLFFKKRIKREDVIKLVTDEDSGISALYYCGSKPGEQTVSFLIVSIAKKNREAFESALRAFKRDIVIESNSKEKEE